MFLVISCSLNPSSRSRVLAQRAHDHAGLRGASTYFDLIDHPLPLCDDDSAYDAPHVKQLADLIRSSRVVLLATPIYNYDASAAAKNVVELTGSAWRDKVVGFLCAAGGRSSYMSVLGLANSLMLDFRCLIVPRFVYATEHAFTHGRLTDKAIEQRIGELVAESLRLAGDLEPREPHDR